MFNNIRTDYDTHGRTLRDGGFWAMFVFRYGEWSMKRRFPPWRWLTSAVYVVLNLVIQMTTGVRIERGMQVGERFHIIHTGMLQVHPHAIIGDRCGVMHNVTIGTNMGPECPVIGDDVFIGVGSSVLGGVTIGNDARIAGNTLVISDVPAGAVAMGVPAKIYPNMDRLRALKKKKKKEPKQETAQGAADSKPSEG